jgi:hypothetical protein
LESGERTYWVSKDKLQLSRSDSIVRTYPYPVKGHLATIPIVISSLEQAMTLLREAAPRWSGQMKGYRGKCIIDSDHLELDIDRLMLS